MNFDSNQIQFSNSKQVAGIIGIEDGSQAFMYIIC